LDARFARRLGEPGLARLLDLLDLIGHEAQLRPVASQLGQALAGSGSPAPVRGCSIFSAALRSFGLKPRMPSRACAPFIRLTMRLRSLTRLSRSREGRLPAATPRASGRSI
jgi:hypothetical protein